MPVEDFGCRVEGRGYARNVGVASEGREVKRCVAVLVYCAGVRSRLYPRTALVRSTNQICSN